MLQCKDCPQFHPLPSSKNGGRMSDYGLCMLHLISAHKDDMKMNQCPTHPAFTNADEIREGVTDA